MNIIVRSEGPAPQVSLIDLAIGQAMITTQDTVWIKLSHTHAMRIYLDSAIEKDNDYDSDEFEIVAIRDQKSAKGVPFQGEITFKFNDE